MKAVSLAFQKDALVVSSESQEVGDGSQEIAIAYDSAAVTLAPQRALPRTVSRSGRNEGRPPLREGRAGAVSGSPGRAFGRHPQLPLRRDADEDVVGRVEILSLSTEGFRNLLNGRVELHPRVNLIVGDNGQGKTNLLEALALVSGRPSFRTRELAEARQHLAARSVVSAPAARRRGRSPRNVTTLGFVHAGGAREQYRDGKRVTRLTAARSLPAVFLTARDLSRLSGPPAERRRALGPRRSRPEAGARARAPGVRAGPRGQDAAALARRAVRRGRARRLRDRARGGGRARGGRPPRGPREPRTGNRPPRGRPRVPVSQHLARARERPAGERRRARDGGRPRSSPARTEERRAARPAVSRRTASGRPRAPGRRRERGEPGILGRDADVPARVDARGDVPARGRRPGTAPRVRRLRFRMGPACSRRVRRGAAGGGPGVPDLRPARGGPRASPPGGRDLPHDRGTALTRGNPGRGPKRGAPRAAGGAGPR